MRYIDQTESSSSSSSAATPPSLSLQKTLYQRMLTTTTKFEIKNASIEVLPAVPKFNSTPINKSKIQLGKKTLFF